MAEIDGIDAVRARLEEIQQRAAEAKSTTIVVGFTQNYAIYVHENLHAFHRFGKAKYLEDPARELATELADIVAEAYTNTKSLKRALLVAGLRLQREAQLQVPVDTGALKASAFTREE